MQSQSPPQNPRMNRLAPYRSVVTHRQARKTRRSNLVHGAASDLLATFSAALSHLKRDLALLHRSALRNRGGHTRVVACATLLLGACALPRLPESQFEAPRRNAVFSDTAVFILRFGDDTAAIDRVTWQGNQITGAAVAGRTMSVDYRLVFDSTGEVRSYAFLLGPPPATVGDSVTFTQPAVGSPTSVVSRGRIPLWHATPGLYGVLLRRAWIALASKDARLRADSTVALPLFRFGAASVKDSAFVTLIARDSARLLVQADGAPPTEMFARVDEGWRLLRAAVPSEGWVIERVRSLPLSAFALAPAYGAPEGAPYRTEEIRIAVHGNTTLVGTLTLPIGVHRSVPAVVLLHGSTPSDRNNSRRPLPGLFWQLADTLARRGIAVLRYDQRGVGASTGFSDSATVHVRADDARAALAYLMTRPDIDSARLGLIGLSEGAMAAPLAAGLHDSARAGVSVRAVVLISSPARKGRELSAYQTRVSVERFAGLTGRARDSALLIGRAEDDSLLRSGRGHDAALLAYDPLPAVRKLATPALILHGATDIVVPAEDAVRLGAELEESGNRDVTVHVLPNLNHVLLTDRSGDWRRYIAVPSLIVPSLARGLIADWLVERLGDRR